MKTKIDFGKLIASIAICQAAGLLGSAFVSGAPAFYESLVRPGFAPPNWVFGPVWITLYTLMGISLYLIWMKGLQKKNVRNAVGIFGLQLILNAAWTPVFFGAGQIFLAFAVIVALWIAILATIVMFYKISRTAAYLLLPYIVWVTIAAALNYSIWVLN